MQLSIWEDLGFSRGGGFFCRSTKFIVRSTRRPFLINFFEPQACSVKKTPKNVFRHFLHSFDQEIAFFRAIGQSGVKSRRGGGGG